jgi:excisionase family DNA binding protein
MPNGLRQDVDSARGSLVAERKGPLRSAGRSVKAHHEELLTAPEATPFLMSVTEAAKLLGWGRTKLYHAIQRGYFNAGVVHVGTSISISPPALFRWLETVGQPGAPPTSTR